MARLIAMRAFLLKRLIRDGFLDDKYFTKQSHISADHHKLTHPTTTTTTTNFKRRIDLSDNDEECAVQGKRKKQKKITPTTDTNQKGRKSAKKKTRPPPPPPSSLLLLPPVMSHNMQHIITQVLNGTNPLWLTSKRLTRSDTNSKLNRFFLPHCEALEEFMTTEEKEKLLVSMIKTTTTTDQNNKKRKKGLGVIVIDRKGEQWEVNLKIWESLGQYVLTKDWNKIVEKLNMVPFLDQVLLWCFRLPAESGSKLCLAIDIEKTYFS